MMQLTGGASISICFSVLTAWSALDSQGGKAHQLQRDVTVAAEHRHLL
jgi:hypothetical protein